MSSAPSQVTAPSGRRLHLPVTLPMLIEKHTLASRS